MIATAPQRTSVLAVGLERYEWGEALDLPGAADHAVRFAQWAAKQNVPPERIRLACTWLEEPAASPVPGAVTVETTHAGLEKALYDLMAEGGDLLLLYWCGHGVTEEGTNRALFTSNATESLKRHLPLGEIQRLLTSSKGAGFAQVVLVVDACANFLEQLNAERSLPRLGFGELAARETPLFLYLSTDLGQIAEIDPKLRRATFSTYVITWLEEADDGLPPDLDRLRRDVDDVFAERARTGGFRQRPVSVIVRTVGGSEEHVTYISQENAARLQHSQQRRTPAVQVPRGHVLALHPRSDRLVIFRDSAVLGIEPENGRVVWSRDARWIAAAGSSGCPIIAGATGQQLTFLDIVAGQPLRQFRVPLPVACLALSSGGRVLAAGTAVPLAGGNADIYVIDPLGGETLRSLRGMRSTVVHACFSTDGDLVGACSRDGSVLTWDVQTGHIVDRFNHNRCRLMAFSTKGTLLAVSGDRDVALWNRKEGRLQAKDCNRVGRDCSSIYLRRARPPARR